MTPGKTFALGCALVGATTFAALPALTQENKLDVVFILADNVGNGDLGSYGGGKLRGRRYPISTNLPAGACVSHSIWSSPAAHDRAPRC